MKAAIYYGKHDLRVEEVLKPIPKSGEVLIEISACGICGTDVHIYEGDEGAAPSPAGIILGHEFSGTVVETGPNVKNVKIGDQVCVDPNKLCGQCLYCKSGLGHFCENMIGIGTTVHGGFAQYCAVPEEQAYPYSDHITYGEAAMAEPVACCLHGIDLCDIKCGAVVAVIGAGMIGLLMIQLARLNGAVKVIVIEPVAGKRKMALELGADMAIDPVNQSVQAVLEECGVGRIDVVIECVGRTDTMQQAIKIAGKKSVVMMFGLTKPEEELPIKPFELFKKEIVLKASFINPYTQGRAVALINSGRIDVKSMVYQTASLDELPAILSDIKLRAMGKFMIDPRI